MKKPSSARPSILPCQAMFGLERGQQIVDLIESTTGDLCPCKRGIPCALLAPPTAERLPILSAAV